MNDKPHRKGKIIEEQKKVAELGANGEIIRQTETQTTKIVNRSFEPDYIKLYINFWKEGPDSLSEVMNQQLIKIPEFARNTFIQLALRMTYCNSGNFLESHFIKPTGTTKMSIMKACNITSDQVWFRHLKALVDCDAIRPVIINGKKSRGEYQINPHLVGKGSWLYSNSGDIGGIKDFVAYWDAGCPNTSSRIVYAANGNNSVDAKNFGIKPGEKQVMTVTEYWEDGGK